MKRGVPELDDSPLSYISALLNPYVVAGIALLILWTLSRMAFLSWADLSFVAPVTALGYILAALAGLIVLGEQISGRRWFGIVLIAAGTFLVARTEPRTASAGKDPSV